MMSGKRPRSDSAGYTLAETLVSMSILVLVIASVTSVLFFGEASSRAALEWTDSSQQLRVAMKQISEDFTYARNVSGTSGEFSLTVKQPLTAREGVSDFDWSVTDASWPGDLKEWPDLEIRYTLQGGVLVRRVAWWSSVYSQQTLATGLDASSFIRPSPSNPQLIQVRLSMQPSGVNRYADVYGEFHSR